MVGYDPPLLLAHDAVLLLLADKNDLHRLEQILLADDLSAVLHGVDRRLIDHIGKVRSDRTGRSQSDRLKIYAVIHPYILGMYFQDIDTSLQIRFVHDDPSVKTSRAEKSRIKDLRTVRRRQDQKSLVRVKSVHLRKKLVQRLLPLIIAAHSGITCLSDRIDLIDKYDTWCLLLRLLEQIPHTGRSDADIHFYERRA